jgi:quercetin dioxygenase-like cupin family protein
LEIREPNAEYVVKEANLQVVLTLIKAGLVLKGHKAEGNVSIQVLHGRIRVNVDGITARITSFGILAVSGVSTFVPG